MAGGIVNYHYLQTFGAVYYLWADRFVGRGGKDTGGGCASRLNEKRIIFCHTNIINVLICMALAWDTRTG